MTFTPPAEAEEPPDYPYCEAIAGVGPHNYQPAADILGGTGIWLICTNCGDYFRIDGTGVAGATTPTPAPSPAGALPQPGSTAAPTSTKPWMP